MQQFRVPQRSSRVCETRSAVDDRDTRTAAHKRKKSAGLADLFRFCEGAQLVLNLFTSMKLTALPLKRAVSTVPAILEKPAA